MSLLQNQAFETLQQAPPSVTMERWNTHLDTSVELPLFGYGNFSLPGLLGVV